MPVAIERATDHGIVFHFTVEVHGESAYTMAAEFCKCHGRKARNDGKAISCTTHPCIRDIAQLMKILHCTTYVNWGYLAGFLHHGQERYEHGLPPMARLALEGGTYMSQYLVTDFLEHLTIDVRKFFDHSGCVAFKLKTDHEHRWHSNPTDWVSSRFNEHKEAIENLGDSPAPCIEYL